MSSRSIAYRIGCATMRARFSGFATAVLGAVGQLALCEGPLAGALIAGALALVSPWAAAGALAGATFGTAVGAAGMTRSTSAWRHGLAGYNTAIVGLLWGGLAAQGDFNLPLFVALLALCAAFDEVFRQGLARLALPVLSLPAMAVAIVASLVLAAPGTWFWVDAPMAPLGWPGLAGAGLLAVGAMARQAPVAAGWATALAALAYLGILAWGLDPLAHGELWALNVPLASFAVQGVFVRAPRAGLAGGALAAGFAALIWIVWRRLGIGDVAPPLLMPFILGVWLALAILRARTALALWHAARALRAAMAEDRALVALVGDDDPRGAADPGPTTADGARIDLSDERLRDSLQCRRAHWAVCAELRRAPGEPGAAHRRLAALERRGWLRAAITTDIHGRLRRAGVRDPIELLGRIDRTVCLDCGAHGDWPPEPLWRRLDPRCPECGGATRPDVMLWGDQPAPAVNDALEQVVAARGVFLVLGQVAADPWAARVLARARAHGAFVIFISNESDIHGRMPDDTVVRANESRGLAALIGAAIVLRRLWPVWPQRRSPRAWI